jgi:steroid delta-isomerase-like uncharacterized protein
MDAQTAPRMQPKDMDRLIEMHIGAEMAGDSSAAVSVYTDDVEHDVVGWPGGPLQGRAAARDFYDHLISNIQTETMVPTRRYYGEDFCVQEHQWTGTIPGNFLGVPGHGKHICFRLLHVWEFRDGKISRENVWLDGGTIVAQLTASGEDA